jgi:hypothetical protein
MKRHGWSVLVLALVAAGGRADDSIRLDEYERLVVELKAVLKGIKVGASAKQALPKLERLDKQLDELVRVLKKRKPDKKDAARLEKAARALDKEVMRLDVDAKTPKAVRDLPLFRRHREAMMERAKVDAEGLSGQVEIYKLNNGNYPATISALAEKQPGGRLPLIPKDKVRDPWGREYKLDPAGKRNNGLKADVWSLGHPLEKKLIGNWRSKEDDKGKGTKKDGGGGS